MERPIRREWITLSVGDSLAIAVVVPVLNGGDVWRRAAIALRAQTIMPVQVLVIDSGSTDDSVGVAERAGFHVQHIDKRTFDHGGTRQRAAETLRDVDVVVFLTQDAVLAAPEALEKLIGAFNDNGIGVAYGRQFPRPHAGVLEAHARTFNYPPASHVCRFDDRHSLGIKAAFVSNSFAAYRRSALMDVGGFPTRLILSEDMVVTARMLLAGWSAAYVASACVFHSHRYTIRQELQRYFDIGVLHHDQYWILQQFGHPEGEGVKFMRSELGYVLRRAPWRLPEALVRSIAKYIGYRLGGAYLRLPDECRSRLSMNKGYWNYTVGHVEAHERI